MTEKEEDKGFSVKDRRIFSESGGPRVEEGKEKIKQEMSKEEEPVKKDRPGRQAGKQEEEKRDFAYPEVNFSHFVLSLHTSALYHFGDFQDPSSGETEKNLPAAKQTIDILSMLKEKTAENLTENEQHLLDGALFELRMRFVKESGLK